MSTRSWLYQRMTNDVPLIVLLPGGVHQTTALNATPHGKPFVMFRQTSDTPNFRGDGEEQVRANGYMIFVHDVPGDYLKIDAVMEQLKTLFQDIVDQANGVVKSFWIETSDDIRDDDMGTIMKFARIQVIHRV